MSLAICPGSFDPITLGHLDIISRSAQIFDNVIVCIMFNSNKTKPMFTISERVEMVKKVVECFPNVRVDTSTGLLAEYAKQFDGAVIVKGLRAASDFEYEFQMALTNKKLNNELETIFLTTRADNMYLSSSIVKDIASFGGDISDFVPPQILEDIRERLYTGGKDS